MERADRRVAIANHIGIGTCQIYVGYIGRIAFRLGLILSTSPVP